VSPPWRDFLGKYCNFYIIYKSWQYSLRIACQVWARGASCLVYAVDSIVFHELSMLHHILSNQVWARAKVPKVKSELESWTGISEMVNLRINEGLTLHP